jgi:RNA polymerase sigma-70 factor (ECF subfamily)
MPIPKEQFESELLANLDSLYRIALRLARNPILAEELTQEASYRAIRSMHTYDPAAGGMKPWLVRILRNTFLTRLERESKQPQAVEEQTLEHSKVAPVPAAAGHNFTEYLDQELVRALDALPEEYRMVLMLWAIEEFTYQEIADALEVPIGTVMSRLHRARGKLVEQLGDFARKEGILRE